MITLMKQLSETVSENYSFYLQHKTNDDDDDDPKQIEMSEVDMLAFPFALHEFAYSMPNSTFRSAGATFGNALIKPQLTSNRSNTTFIVDTEIPHHEFSITPSGHCKLRFKETPIPPIPPDSDQGGGGVYSNPASVFAHEILKRFQWMATEKHNEAIMFKLIKRVAIKDLQSRADDISESSHLVPIVIELSNIKYDSLAMKDLRHHILDNTTNDAEKSIYDRREELNVNEGVEHNKEQFNPPLPPTIYDKINNKDAQQILKTRLENWNDNAPDKDPQYFRPQTYKKQLSSSNPQTANTSQYLKHVFYRPIKGTTDSQLIRCEVKISKNKVHTIPEKRTNPSSVEVLFDISRLIPDIRDNTGIRTPLFQRFIVLLASEDTRNLLKSAVESNSNVKKTKDNSIDKLVSRCAEYRALHILIEAVAVAKKVSSEITKEIYAQNIIKDALSKIYRLHKEDTYSRWLTKLAAFPDLHQNIMTAVEKYPKFYDKMKEFEEWTSDDQKWIEFGGTPNPIEISIKLTASPFGKGPSTLSGVTPETMEDFLPALRACIARLLFDPSPVDIRKRAYI